MRSFLLAAAAAAALATPAAAQTQAATIVHAGRVLVDPASGRVETQKSLVIRGGKVVRIADGYISEPGATVIDLKTRFVLPGLIDSHVHLTGEQNPNARLEEVTQSSAEQALVGARYARRTLMAGFTTVADLGADTNAILALRKATAAGDVPGPRIVASGSAISVHGGHGDVNGFRDDIMHLLRPNSVCSGADDCARAV
ncbi:MAG: amidohydrolase family protein, partial [Phenylobacterium sp.]|uniref:amidohydrolase family protein n=1 Tax=Phenylobacterium sp. TaxID=1871053 RepID=UPI001A592F73